MLESKDRVKDYVKYDGTKWTIGIGSNCRNLEYGTLKTMERLVRRNQSWAKNKGYNSSTKLLQFTVA